MRHSAGYGIRGDILLPGQTYGTCVFTGRQRMTACGDRYRKEHTDFPRCWCTGGQTDRDWRNGVLQMPWFLSGVPCTLTENCRYMTGVSTGGETEVMFHRSGGYGRLCFQMITDLCFVQISGAITGISGKNSCGCR